MVDLYAVCGRPVAHSRSPQMFNAAFSAAGANARYLRLGAADAPGAWRAFQALGLRGMNVTAPFKRELLSRAGRVDPAAAAIGATNCLVAKDHAVVAHNTDWQGVCAALRRAGVALAGRTCLVLGAGGAARGAAYGLVRSGARVIVGNRSAARAQRLAVDLGCQATGLVDLGEVLERVAVVVSSLPDGVDVGAGRHLRRGQVVLEAAYHEPVLRRAAERAGARYLGGEEWLLEQARAASGIFLGRPAEVRLMHRALRRKPPARGRGLVLVGFMGAGKSLLGRMLAERLGYEFVDTDELVCRDTGASIGEIFSNGGEARFRKLEREAVAALDGRQRVVVACGGGAVLDSANREVLCRAGLVVWLWVDAEVARRRAAGPVRPLLGAEVSTGAVERLLRSRLPHYAAVADLVLDTSNLEPAAAVEVLCEEARIARST